jgi:signal transduction histidine kinase
VVRALVVACGLALFVAVVYALVVVGGGILLGRTGAPSQLLSVVATTVVALGFEPVRRHLRRWAAHSGTLPGRIPSVLVGTFVAGAQSGATPRATASRMATVLAQGLDAASAQVWLITGDRMVCAGVFPETAALPEEAEVGPGPGVAFREVRHAGEAIGLLLVRLRDGEELAPVECQLLDGLAAAAGLVLHNLRLTAELDERFRAAAARAAELDAVRASVVALEDEERRLLERNIHDGAQQHLVALALTVRVAQARLLRRPEDVPALLAGIDAAVSAAEADLFAVLGERRRVIAEAGLAAALRAVTDTSPVPARLTITGPQRYPSEVEEALFYSCVEALQNAAKHADATEIVIDLRGDATSLTATIQDDGRGFVPDGTIARSRQGLANITERIAALHGSLDVRSAPGAGTTIAARVPLGRSERE